MILSLMVTGTALCSLFTYRLGYVAGYKLKIQDDKEIEEEVAWMLMKLWETRSK